MSWIWSHRAGTVQSVIWLQHGLLLQGVPWGVQGGCRNRFKVREVHLLLLTVKEPVVNFIKRFTASHPVHSDTHSSSNMAEGSQRKSHSPSRGHMLAVCRCNWSPGRCGPERALLEELTPLLSGSRWSQRQHSQIWRKWSCASWPFLAPHAAVKQLSPLWTSLKSNFRLSNELMRMRMALTSFQPRFKILAGPVTAHFSHSLILLSLWDTFEITVEDTLHQIMWIHMIHIHYICQLFRCINIWK